MSESSSDETEDKKIGQKKEASPVFVDHGVAQVSVTDSNNVLARVEGCKRADKLVAKCHKTVDGIGHGCKPIPEQRGLHQRLDPLEGLDNN